jgi:hypothetical protein
MSKRVKLNFKVKTDIVLLMLKGEDLDFVSSKYCVTKDELELWKNQFIESGSSGFRHNRQDPMKIAYEHKIEKLKTEIELLRKKERLGYKNRKEMIAELMKDISSTTNKPFPKRMIFKVVGYSSSTWYENPTPEVRKRGRKPKNKQE